MEISERRKIAAQKMSEAARKLIGDAPESSELLIDIDSLRETLSKITPCSPEVMRAFEFKNTISQKMKACGWTQRFRALDPLIGLDPRAALQRAILEKLKSACIGVGAIVALVGPRGTGKTTIAAALAQSRLWEDSESRKGWRLASYYKLTDVIAKFKSRYGDWGTTQTEQLERLRLRFGDEELAVIDEWHEIDDEDSKHKGRITTDLLDLRYSNRTDTLIISNETKETFEKKLPESILSRLNENGGTIRCEWESFRDKPAKNT